jgi:hypothetical protein
MRIAWILSMFVFLQCSFNVSFAAPTCPISYGGADGAKPNKLYLYFPGVSDTTFPEFGISDPSSPAVPFNTSNLSSYTGTETDLRNSIFDVVSNIYCEFNVQVLQTTTAPPTTFARRNTIAIGTDPAGPYGQAQDVDTGDAVKVDFARVWGGTYQNQFGGPGKALNGSNSTLSRWANALGGTTAHEAGHNYGIAHNTVVASGEDSLIHHIMPAGINHNGEQRANPRHFSDNEYSILASNLGLSIQTMHNWDLINPNAQTGARLRIRFLSTQSSLIQSWSYAGPLSPWNTPVISGPSGTTVFNGATYNNYFIEWSNGQAWNNGASGQVPGGAAFHIGATFSGVNFSDPDPIIITDVRLIGAGGTPLALRPRMVGYNAGALSTADGALNLSFFNTFSEPIIISNVIVQQLPRMISIESMTQFSKPLDPFGLPVNPWKESSRRFLTEGKTIKKGETVQIALAKLSDGRHIVEQVDSKSCNKNDDPSGKPDTRGCRPGLNIDLFPATTVFVKATITSPNAKSWDPSRKKYVIGPLSSQIYLQFAGRHPDLNKNRVDDFRDILSGKSKDFNKDGVPDEMQKQSGLPVNQAPAAFALGIMLFGLGRRVTRQRRK